MPALQNQRHETFVQGLMSGLTGDEAYIRAGYKPNRFNASRLKTTENVLARMRELQEITAKAVNLDVQWVLTRLASNVERALQAEKPTEEGGEYKYDGAVANRGLELIGKHLGMFKERIEIGGHIQIANMELLEKLTPEERAQMRALLMAAAQRETANADARMIEGEGLVQITAADLSGK